MSLAAVPTAPEEIHGLARAFDGFTAATARLEREYATLRARLMRLTVEVEVTNLLEFTRTQVPRKQRVDCCALAEETLRYLADLSAAHAIVVERRYAAPAVFAVADQHLLRPVLLNLMRNAAQAMPGGGTLTIGVEVGADGTRLTVADTGPGIPAGAEADIFRPFFTTRAKGTGLGLAVVQELVVAMGGTLAVASEPGRGAAFTVVLPAAEEAA